jgi:hypothetical protein
VRFGSLDFVVTTEGELVQALTRVQSPSPTGLCTITEALEELQLDALEAHTPGRDQPLSSDFRRLEHQLAVYLGPHPSWKDLRALTFSFVNTVAQLTGGGRSPQTS